MTTGLAIIGAGPAGMAAAALAAELGVETALIDEQASPGGQIYRGIERSRPRTYGTTQNAQNLSHPRIAVTYARTPPP